MAYSAIADSEIDPESAGTTTLFNKLRDNPEEVFANGAGAPEIDGAAITNLTIPYSALNLSNSIDAGDIAPNAVDTSELAAGAVEKVKIQTATVSLNGNVSGTNGSPTLFAMNGYAFFPMIHCSRAGAYSGSTASARTTMSGHTSDGASADSPRFSLCSDENVSYATATYDVDYRYISA